MEGSVGMGNGTTQSSDVGFAAHIQIPVQVIEPETVALLWPDFLWTKNQKNITDPFSPSEGLAPRGEEMAK